MKKIVLISVLLFASSNAMADQWIAYTDGRVGGCWLNSANQLYGCTPQPQQQQSNTSNSAEERCRKARIALNDPNRTIDSVRSAERTIQEYGCNN